MRIVVCARAVRSEGKLEYYIDHREFLDKVQTDDLETDHTYPKPLTYMILQSYRVRQKVRIDLVERNRDDACAAHQGRMIDDIDAEQGEARYCDDVCCGRSFDRTDDRDCDSAEEIRDFYAADLYRSQAEQGKDGKQPKAGRQPELNTCKFSKNRESEDVEHRSRRDKGTVPMAAIVQSEYQDCHCNNIDRKP